MTGDPFWLAVDYVQSLTYREAYWRHVWPAVKAQKGAGLPAAASETPVADQKAFIDQLCRGKKYEGEMWWLPLWEKNKDKMG